MALPNPALDEWTTLREQCERIFLEMEIESLARRLQRAKEGLAALRSAASPSVDQECAAEDHDVAIQERTPVPTPTVPQRSAPVLAESLSERGATGAALRVTLGEPGAVRGAVLCAAVYDPAAGPISWPPWIAPLHLSRPPVEDDWPEHRPGTPASELSAQSWSEQCSSGQRSPPEDEVSPWFHEYRGSATSSPTSHRSYSETSSPTEPDVSCLTDSGEEFQ